MSDIQTGTSAGVSAFLVRLWRYSPRRVVTVWLLGGAVAMTEGIGLMMLVPLLGLLGIGTNATDGGMTLSLPFADTLLPAYETPSIGLALILFVGLVGLRQALKYKSDMQGAQLRLDFVDSLRNTLFRRMAGSEWSYISQVRHGDLMQAFSGEVASVGLGVQQLQALFVGAALTAVYLVGALLLAPSTLLPALIGIGFVAALLFRWTHRYSVERGHELVETLKQQKHGIEQFLGSLKWAKAHGLEGRHIDRFEDQTRAARTSMLAHHANRSAEQALFHLGAAITLAFVAWLAVRSDWPTGQWIAFVVVIARLVPLLSRLLQNVHQVLHMLPTFTQLVGLENGCLHHAEPPSQGDIPPIALEEAIDIRGLEFAYTQGTPSVRIEALQLPACGTYALVGASGAGKTTVADLLAGLLSPLRGEIRIDDKQLDGATRHAWRKSIAYVPQDSVLFDASVRENLADTVTAADEDALWAALHAAAAADFVRALPEGLDTVLGPSGARLSGGERQRIALARALLRRPTLLILDEATSALDAGNERHIQAAIERLRGELTLIVIAHRLETVRGVDRIAVIHEGELVQWGSWDELATDEAGVFAQMIRAGRNSQA